MNEPLFSRLAQDDLQEIWAYIASDDPHAADRLEADIRKEVQSLVELPSLGHRRRDLTTHDLWFHNVRKNYLVVYRLSQSIEVVRILHGSRDAVRDLK